MTLTPLLRSQFPAAWVLLFFVGLLKFNLSFLPIVLLALVFNITNTVGYTYAVRSTLHFAALSAPFAEPFPDSPFSTILQDRDAKRKWATGMAAGGMMGGLGGFGGSLVTGMASQALGKFFG